MSATVPWYLNFVHATSGALWTGIDDPGIGALLPINLMIYFEMRKPRPDGARIGRLMRRFVWFVTCQGLLQVAMIVCMARFVTGL
jgi:putative copper export protein